MVVVAHSFSQAMNARSISIFQINANNPLITRTYSLLVFSCLQSMVVTQNGDRTAHAQRRVEVENKLDNELAPIHLQMQEGQTAVNSGQVLRQENVTIKNAQVRAASSFSQSMDYMKK